MSKDTKALTGYKHVRSLYARFLAQECFPEVLDLRESIETHFDPSVKCSEFSIQPGVISCRITVGDERSVLTRLRCQALGEAHWDSLVELLSEKAFYASQLLAGQLPNEVAELAKAHEIPLIPQETLHFEVDGVGQEQFGVEAATFFINLNDALEDEPCQFLFFRGKAVVELLAELRKKRLTQTAERRRPTAITELAYPASPAVVDRITEFWSMGAEVKELHYSIKADELPASILKWLSPLPLSGIEDNVDFVLEEGYARIARLAQGFGLGL